MSFLLHRLSGESPFQGNDDVETLALVTAAQWEFDEESFEEITEEAKNFISSLLEKDPRWFITACHATSVSPVTLCSQQRCASQEEDVLCDGHCSLLDGRLRVGRAGEQESVQGEDEEISCQTEVEGDTSTKCALRRWFKLFFFFVF